MELSPNGQEPEQGGGGALAGPAGQVFEEVIIHDCAVMLSKVGSMSLLHFDVPGRRYTVKLAHAEAVDRLVGVLRGIEITRQMP